MTSVLIKKDVSLESKIRFIINHKILSWLEVGYNFGLRFPSNQLKKVLIMAIIFNKFEV